MLFSGLFSQLPSVFAGHITQDALQVLQSPSIRLWAGKARSKASMQVEQGFCLTADIGRGSFGASESNMLILLHHLLLPCGTSSTTYAHFQSVILIGEVHEAFFSIAGISIAQFTSATVVSNPITPALPLGYPPAAP
jgi:hypothetical protein